jgi:hypothetical protein
MEAEKKNVNVDLTSPPVCYVICPKEKEERHSFKDVKPKICVNNIYNLSFYLTENYASDTKTDITKLIS